MLGSLLILLAMPVLDTSRVRGRHFRPLMQGRFWLFVALFFSLINLGAQHAEPPFIGMGQVFTRLYFRWFLIIVPVVGITENTLMDIATDRNTDEVTVKPFISS